MNIFSVLILGLTFAVGYGSNCRDLSGVWQNQLGSNMTIAHLSENHITGEYSTAVESSQRAALITSNITGQFVPVSEGALLSFTVLFNHGKSLTTWVGQCMVCNDEETLFTSWVLRGHTSKLSDKWMVNTINQDTFKRVQSNYITIPDHLRTMGPKPKDAKSTSCEKHLKVSMNGQWLSGSGDSLKFDDCRESGVFSGVNRGTPLMGRKDGGGAFTALGLVSASEDSIKGWAGHIYESSLERNRILETSWLKHSFSNMCKEPRASVQFGMGNYTFVYGYKDTEVKPQPDWTKRAMNYLFSFF
ncbi:hypothetical protein JTE90_023407 [Oedothorax gibbosus]|uniref:Uncharacterized protein n=1 Tax=Oedothorax gibbosus TaxID=931172 RepID=A0AAV6UGF5_9ARAC|nr:hypothetical protein JTE90_023407 [Oedothorax gibbosus]